MSISKNSETDSVDPLDHEWLIRGFYLNISEDMIKGLLRIYSKNDNLFALHQLVEKIHTTFQIKEDP